ncbi:hypothetical protein CR513_04081, partial [Mucuna pruriens]
MPMTRNQVASSTNEGEEDTLQKLLQAVASLQAYNDELLQKKSGRVAVPLACTQAFLGQPFTKEINGKPIPANFREVVVEPFDGTRDPTLIS